MTVPTDESQTLSLLMAIIRRLTTGSLLNVIGTSSEAVLRVCTEWIRKHLSSDETTAILTRGLDSDERVMLGVLTVMKYLDVEIIERALPKITSLLRHPRDEIRRAAVEVIVRCWPEESLRVLAEPRCRDDQKSLRMLCLSENPQLILPLFEAFGFPRRLPPPTIGFLVNPQWLAEHSSHHPQIVEWLARECGYCDCPFNADALEMLSLGISFVVDQMTASGPASDWVERVRTLSWQLLPDAEDLTCRDNKPLNLNDPIDTALFLAAVRETDRMLFSTSRASPLPNSIRNPERLSPVCYHAAARHVRRLFLTEARAMAGELNVRDDQIAAFTIDYARLALETVPEQKIAADRTLRTAWQLRRTSPPVRVQETIRRGGPGPGRTSDRRLSLVPPRQLVIGNFVGKSPNPQLSPCAQSICRLADLSGFDESSVAEWLIESEARWSRFAVPIGIEIQIPKADPNMFGAWKDALPFLGIPSPSRPEFGGMLEAAFRPAKSVHSLLLAPLLLHRLGVISKTDPQDMALHISLQGNLGTQARDVAFPQLFIHPSKRLKNRPDSTMTRIMSKGFVHINHDIEVIESTYPERKPAVRTELRMFRLFCDELEQQTNISLTYVEDLIATHLIASAILSECQDCRRLAVSYGQMLKAETASLPLEFSRLLVSNFYESTGDPRDETLMRQLPIFRAWSEVRTVVRERNLHDDLNGLFRRIRTRYVQSLSQHVAIVHGIDMNREAVQWFDWIRKVQPVGASMNEPESPIE